MRRFCSQIVLLGASAGVIVSASGCQSGGGRRAQGPVLEPLAKEEAVRLVNNNIAQVGGTLRATGSVDGHFVSAESKRRVNYNVDGTLFYLSPYYVRLDLKKLGDRQALFGSNEQYYWAYTKEDNRYVCGRMNGDSARLDIPLEPRQIVEALGLTPIPAGGAAAEQKVHGEYQQLIFKDRDYWLDRRAPRLIRKVVFRNPDGSVAMSSDLSDYRPAENGAMLPHLVDARWPARNARLRFDVGRWTPAGEVAPGGPQFATPEECLRGGRMSAGGRILE